MSGGSRPPLGPMPYTDYGGIIDQHQYNRFAPYYGGYSTSYIAPRVAPSYGRYSYTAPRGLMSTPVRAQSDDDPSGDGPSPPRHGPVALSHTEDAQRLAREWNESHRMTHVTAIQTDRAGRVWHVNMAKCEAAMDWNELRKSPVPPRFLYRWNRDDGQFECDVTVNPYVWEG